MDVDFTTLNACGGDCSGCEHYIDGYCAGCRANGGKCVKMWEHGCEICRCCIEHDVPFCGLCTEFPCTFISDKLTEWDSSGITRQEQLAEEYRGRKAEFVPYLTQLRDKIGSHGVMTLSTCAKERVTSRAMSVVVIDGKFLCQTGEGYLKYRQLQDNPHAALCFGSFSVEGICRILGHPTEHDTFLSAMREFFPSAAERWSGQPFERVLEITPTLIYSWVYEENIPYMEYYDLVNMTYRKERKL